MLRSTIAAIARQAVSATAALFLTGLCLTAALAPAALPDTSFAAV